MILSFLRRFGAALVFSLATFSLAPATEPDAAVDKAAGSVEGKAAPAPAAAPTSTAKANEEAEREGRRHGARSKATDGSLLVWDNVNSVWIATGRKNTYWVDGRFFQSDEGIWLSSKVLAGPWELTPQRLVPESPRGRHLPPKVSVTATLPSGLEAIYEPRIKVFKIAGRKGLFLFDAVFYRYDAGVWLESKSADGPWTTTSSVVLPQVLRRALPPPEKGAKATLPTGEVLVSEGEPNLFGVEGKPAVLYFDGTFYERRDQKWFQSGSLSANWEETPSQKIPGPVRSNYHKGTGKDAAKAGDRKKHGAAKGGGKKKTGAAD